MLKAQFVRQYGSRFIMLLTHYLKLSGHFFIMVVVPRCGLPVSNCLFGTMPLSCHHFYRVVSQQRSSFVSCFTPKVNV